MHNMLSDTFPNLEIEYYPILESVLGRDIHQLMTDNSLAITQDQLNTIHTLLGKAQTGIPIPYLTGQAFFYRDVFKVNRSVLIPRPETEYLVEAVLSYVTSQKGLSKQSILDICTGSGCIGISIAKYVSLPIDLYLTDISPEALDVCRINVQTHLSEQKNRHIVPSDLLKNLPADLVGRVNVIVSNPPYIPSSRISNLDPEVRDFEPQLALDGGATGLETTIELLRQARPLLAPHFFIIIEIDEKQDGTLQKSASELFAHAQIEIKKDLFGSMRYLEILK